MSSSPYTAKWGILATGGIASKFTKDLLLDPATRDVKDVRHDVVAVASSSGAERAAQFVKDNGCAQDTKAYGTYEELVKDPNVQIIYVATPHTYHYDNTLLALEHGKAVCCEKPFVINAAQAKHLFEVAKAKNLFVMEAVWIRFFPVVIELQRLLHQERVIGKIIRVHADFGKYFKTDVKHRLFAPELGGGALLDLGIYPLSWLMITLYSDPDNAKTYPSKVSSSMLKVPETQVDGQTTAGLVFEKLGATGTLTATSSVHTNFNAYHTLIQGEKGNITVHGAPYRPESFTIQLKENDSDRGEDVGKPTVRQFSIPGHGMFWEADACARCLRDGKIEEPRCTWQDTMTTMTIMDTIRKQNDFSYPANLESTKQ